MDNLGKYSMEAIIWLQKQFNFYKTSNFGQHIYSDLIIMVTHMYAVYIEDQFIPRILLPQQFF